MDGNLKHTGSERSLLHPDTSLDNQPKPTKYEILRDRMLLFIKENEQFKDELIDLNRSYQEEKAKRIECEEQLVASHKKVETLEGKLGDVQDKLNSTYKKYEEISYAASIAERERKIVEERYHIDEDRISDLENELKEANLIVSSSAKRIEELTEQFEENRQKADLYEKQCLQLQQALSNTESELLSASKTAMLLGQNNNKMDDQLGSMLNELDKQKRINQLYDDRLAQANNEYDQLLKQLGVVEKQLEIREQMYQRLQVEMETYVRDVNTM